MANRVIPTNMPHPVSFVAWDGTDFRIVTIDTSGHLQVDLLSSALPTGAATAANQATEITALQLIDDLRNALLSVNADRLQVGVLASVLPTGAATSANQATELTDLETMMLYDRTLLKVVNTYSAALAAHADTTRYTYTVPAGKRALLEAVYLDCTAPDGTNIAQVNIRINGVICIRLRTVVGSTTPQTQLLNWSGAIWLTAGDIVTVTTLSQAGINVTMTACTVISQFDA